MVLPSVLLANVQRLEKLQYDICLTETWLDDDAMHVVLSGLSMQWQDRTAASGKLKGGGVFFS
jgi:hypothetical protein